MFCKQLLAYAVHIDWCYAIYEHSSRSQHAPRYMMTSGCIVVASRADIYIVINFKGF